LGKIARDQHLPSIEADPRFELAAVASRNLPGDLAVPGYKDLGELLTAMPGKVDAVAICTPPSVRHDIAVQALEAGLAVMLEKPPAATLGEIEHLERVAREKKGVLFAAWHSQANSSVGLARALLAERTVVRLRIEWFENVRKWHPGQDWIWEPGGFGVFDPGINALSIVTAVLAQPLFVREATLSVPANKQAPIAARLAFVGEEGALTAEMDWRHTEDEHWTIHLETADGLRIDFLEGGARLRVDGEERNVRGPGEYPGLYARFAELIEDGSSEVDREPLRIVADAVLIGRRETVEAFE